MNRDKMWRAASGATDSGQKKPLGPHYGAGKMEWPVQLSLTHGEARVLQRLLGEVVALRQLEGRIEGDDYVLMSGMQRKIAKQRKRPVLFLTN